jgi:hypothetical protein
MERQSEHGDDARLMTADAARVIAFLAALAVGDAWSFGGLAAVGCWLVTGRGPGGQLLASGFESGAGARHGLQGRSSHNRAAPRATDLHCRISSEATLRAASGVALARASMEWLVDAGPIASSRCSNSREAAVPAVSESARSSASVQERG